MSNGSSVKEERCVIRAWTRTDQARWDRYVLAHEHATFAHRSGWLAVLDRTFGYPGVHLIAERGDRVCGVFPLYLCRSIRGRRGLFSLPHTVYGGPLADDAETESALMDEARVIAKRENATAIDLRNRYPTSLDLTPIPGFLTFEKELPDQVDLVYKSLPKKAREAVNQARKRHHLEAAFEEDLDNFYELLAASYHSLGTPVFPKRMFAAIREQFPEETTMLVVRHESTPVSAVMSLNFRGTIHPLYSGEAPGVRNLKSNNYKYFRLMELAVEAGIKRFDFGRSRADNQGTVKFKLNQGFEAQELPYQIELPAGAEHSVSSPNRGIFLKARTWWRRLPRPVADRLGPPIVKLFP